MHKVKRKQRSEYERIVGVFEHPLAKGIEDRQHSDSEQRADHAPAKRRHAEHTHTQHDKDLAERRMGVLVWV
ncbi:hypothetical protein SDC9_207329 [bioreactor metagenome]|uniref:Uncharacterized protein n=1 Tax=bioreactor metagenome TaxID=1076179 RepID=A0A645J7H2_9ZZZZ